MIVIKLKLDNIYAFRDFEIDMSYPKKILNSTIEDEHLSGYPNFRYKKVNIIMGANASGKTTLGRAMMNIFSFISYKDIEAIEKMVFDSSAKASFLIDFIVKEKKLNRIMLDICPDEDGRRIYTFSYDSEKITSRDSYQSCAMRLDARPGRGEAWLAFLISRHQPAYIPWAGYRHPAESIGSHTAHP